MKTSLVDLIIEQEKRLFLKKEAVSVLADFIDDDFVEINSRAQFHNKTEVIRWLSQKDLFEIQGVNFKASFLSSEIVLLTYISIVKSPDSDAPKQVCRSSIWRSSGDKWRMIFHQGTSIVSCVGNVFFRRDVDEAFEG